MLLLRHGMVCVEGARYNARLLHVEFDLLGSSITTLLLVSISLKTASALIKTSKSSTYSFSS